jgi:hypothetical protein
MATSDSTAQRNAALQTFITSLGASATCKLYSGTKPGPAVAATGTLLATLTFGATSALDANGGTAGSVVSGILTLGGYTQTRAANGTPGYARWSTSGGVAVRDTDVSTSGTGNLVFTGTVDTTIPISGVITYTDGNP